MLRDNLMVFIALPYYDCSAAWQVLTSIPVGGRLFVLISE